MRSTPPPDQRPPPTAADDDTAPALRAPPDVEWCRRGEVRVEKFQEAAIEVFLEKGYRSARLTDIVAHAGGSMTTLYRAFGDKEGLLHAIMRESIAKFGEGLEMLDKSGLPPEHALPIAAERMVAEILSPPHMVTHRIVFAEGLAFPGLRDWFYKHGIAPAQQQLRRYFERERDAGRLRVEAPDIAASQFYMMVFGGVILRSINGMLSAADIPEIQAQARQAVAVLLHGLLPR